ncbi:MAG: hypothetical protein R3F14_12050 [Polyangiaceae bacterium]
MVNPASGFRATLTVLAALLAPAVSGAQTPPPPAAPGAPAASTPPAAPPKPQAWKPPSKLPKLPPPPPAPDTPARLWLIAPGPNELWTMRIDNEGEKAIRIPADIRLLTFEIEVPTADPKRPWKKSTSYKCALPDRMRPSSFPEKRALLLAPGQSYIESFDPRLFCFGKNAAGLVGTAVVRTTFGWDPPPRWSLAAKKPPAPPFAAEGTDNPATTTPLRQLRAPTFMLSSAHPRAARAPAAAPGSPAGPASTTQPAGTAAAPRTPPHPSAAGARLSAGLDDSSAASAAPPPRWT